MGKTLSLEQYEALTYQAAENFNRKDYENALKKFLKLAENNWENPKVHEILSTIYLNLGNTEKSREEFHIYMDLLRRDNPELPAPRSFDELVADAGDISSVEAEYNRIMKKKSCKDPFSSFDVPARLAVLYMSEGKFKQAEDILTRFKARFVDKLIHSRTN